MATVRALVAAAAMLVPASSVRADDLVPGPVSSSALDFGGGFAELYDQLGRQVMGWPLEPERQTHDADAVQLTTRGLAVWRRGGLPQFHDGETTYTLRPMLTIAGENRSAALERRVQCIINRESGGNPNAVNRRSGARGLGQFLPSTWATTPYARYSIFDPAANRAAVGWMLSVGRGGEFVTIGGC
jgi:hypothetical protein